MSEIAAGVFVTQAVSGEFTRKTLSKTNGVTIADRRCCDWRTNRSKVAPSNKEIDPTRKKEAEVPVEGSGHTVRANIEAWNFLRTFEIAFLAICNVQIITWMKTECEKCTDALIGAFEQCFPKCYRLQNSEKGMELRDRRYFSH